MRTVPTVSIIMPAYNAHATIEGAISSIQNQTYKDWELLILDDGSTDRTADKVEAFKDTRIKYYKSTKRLGIAGRLNEGILMAKGKYVARMDADDVSLSARIEKQVTFMEEHSEIDLLGTSIIAISRNGTFLHEYICPSTHQELVSNLSCGIPLYHSTWLGKKEWFLKWRYRKRFFKYGGEDFDLLLRSLSVSNFACLDEPLLAYRYVLSIKRMSCNSLLMFVSLARHKYWKYLFLVIPKFLPRLIMASTYLTIKRMKHRSMFKEQAWKEAE